MDYRKQFFVSPGRKLKLAGIDPAHTAGQASAEEALPEIEKNVTRMADPVPGRVLICTSLVPLSRFLA